MRCFGSCASGSCVRPLSQNWSGALRQPYVYSLFTLSVLRGPRMRTRFALSLFFFTILCFLISVGWRQSAALSSTEYSLCLASKGISCSSLQFLLKVSLAQNNIQQILIAFLIWVFWHASAPTPPTATARCYGEDILTLSSLIAHQKQSAAVGISDVTQNSEFGRWGRIPLKLGMTSMTK